jgi:hypothetical protein
MAYLDGSGNTGSAQKGGSLMYVVGCVLISEDHWSEAFHQMVDLRRRLWKDLRLPTRTEVKAQYLVRGNGPLVRMAYQPWERHQIYRWHIDTLSQMPARAFAVAVDKRVSPLTTGDKIFDLAWEGLLQRLERTCTNEKSHLLLVHDAGENVAVRKWIRKARRYLTAGSAFTPGSMGNKPADLILDDPIPRDSRQSYFVQMADLVAYAAFRSVIPPSTAVGAVCPKTMWDRIGPATHKAVSGLRPRAAPGIVLR